MSSIQNEIIFSIPRQKKHGLNTGGKTGEGPWWSGLFNSKIKVFAKENLCFFEPVYMYPEKQRNSYHGSWLENLISRIVLKINFHLQLGQEDWSSSLFRGTSLLMNKYNYFKDKPKMLWLLFSDSHHSLTFTTEMRKDRHSRNHETARICSIRFPTWEAAEKSVKQAKKKQADFIMFPQNQQALIHVLLLCSFVSRSRNLFHHKKKYGIGRNGVVPHVV